MLRVCSLYNFFLLIKEFVDIEQTSTLGEHVATNNDVFAQRKSKNEARKSKNEATQQDMARSSVFDSHIK